MELLRKRGINAPVLINADEVIALVSSAVRFGTALAENELLRSALTEQHPIMGFVGGAADTKELLAKVRKAAALEMSVLITGESGTGKTLLASAAP